ncbi:response regulator transcription factor [bacterium BFN5]|nr:response regulator transcription factor [bacterium BFN5]QJW44615.1 response regulator transcription factor [bacterium BFN5]
MLKALVVDDEAPARDELKYLLSLEAGLEVVDEADGGGTAISLAAQLKPNVVFIDVEMHGMNGLETAAVIRKVAPQALIVFATAYDEYALKAFEVGAVDYLLKPFEQERIHTTIERLKNYCPDEWQAAASRVDAALGYTRIQVKKLPVEKNGKIVLIAYDAIIYVHAQAGNVLVVTSCGPYNYCGTLTELQERLDGTNMLRVHKSYIVNMDKVKEVIPWFKGTYWLKVEECPDVEIPVSKSQIKTLKDILGLR